MTADRETLSNYLRKATGELRSARLQLREQERREREPIAIVGMSCRLPGGVSSPEQLWELVAAERDGVSGFPEDRGWPLDRLFDSDPDAPGTSYVRESGFLADPADFDAGFFGIGPREALLTDPQQRLLLEAAWEALEDAGVDPAALRGSPTGVFTGVMYHDYGRGSTAVEGFEGVDLAGSLTSGRIAYALGLEGPAVSVDTACSSSLVAMHLASQALRGGECDVALAGGVAVMSTPSSFIEFSRQRGLAPDGRCKSFAAAADGTSWSEGVGLLVLERLSDAERQGHRVLATLRGSAINQDGASNGLTAPNGPSQERVIRQALANAGLKASEVDAVEAHGTGTTLGDPIEAQAILATYGQERGEAKPLALGSLKSNIGHAQAAAGVAGVIKTVMAMRHGVLPKSLHIDEPTPEVDWEAGAVELLREATPWEADGRPRRAGVSSFGISGTNAHVILEQGPEPEPQPDPDPEAPPLQALPFLLSAKSPEALSAQAGRLAAHLEARPELSELDLSFSLATTRATLEHRAAVVGSGREQLLAGLDALVRGEPHAGLVEGKAVAGKLAFMLSGQGAQRPGMGQELYEAFPAYAKALDAVCEQLDPLLGLSLKDHLFAKPKSAKAKRLNNTELTQPALFATEVALYRLLESLGLKPDFLIGHSVGEIGAAHLAGVLSLPDAAKLIAARAQLMGALPEGGAMVAIEAAEQELGELPEDVSLAAVNDPTSLVVSGPEQPVLALAQEWKERGRKTNRLSVSHAFHSVLMEPMLEELKELAATLTFNPPRIPVISNLSGEPLTPEQAASPAYWAAQARGAVRFAQGISYLQAQGTTSYLELGPDGVLCAMAQGSLEGEQASLAPLLRKGRPDTESLLGALAQAHCHGVSVDWPQLFAGQAPQRADLPTYAFQRSRYWLEPRQASGDASSIGQGATDHPLLTATTSLAGQEQTLLSGRLSQKTHPWLADHVVHASAILPGTAFVEMALRAGQEAGAPTIEELTLAAPLVLPAEGAVQVQVRVNAPDEQGRREIEIHSRPEASSGEEVGEWVANATGLLSAEEPAAPEPLGQWPPPGAEPVAIEAIYEQLGALGIDYGPAFSGLAKAWRQGAELFAEVELPPELSDPERYGLHPALLDAAFHLAALETQGEELKVPFSWSGVSLHNPGASTLRVRVDTAAEQGGLAVADAAGAPVISIAAIATRAIDPEQLRAATAGADSLYALEWIEVPTPSAAEAEPEAELFECVPDPELDPAAAAEILCAEVLAALQGAIAADQSLTFLTRNAQAVSEDDSADPAAAAVWGLVRSAQAEHPGRFALIDSDGEEASTQALPAALAVETEPQLAIRAGALRAPRLRPVAGTGQPTPLDPEATVLITGATGGLGALFARHLVTEHGARRLLLVSRSGPEAEGAAELEAELTALGAEARIAACDVSDREALAALIDSIPSAHPLGAVVHAAGVLDDATIEALDPERLGAVFAPKASAAWHLHELTAAHELSHFIAFSSATGTLNHPGQGNYAAANAFLDGLAAKRQATGLPAASLAWGAWEQGAGMVAHLSATDRARLARSGLVRLSEEQGLALFDRSLGIDRAQLAPMALDRGALRAAARAGVLPALLSGLAGVPSSRTSQGSLAAHLAAAAEPEREGLVLELVRAQVAAVLGHPSPSSVDPERAFNDLGFDSLGAVELRNRLGGATGLQLPASLIFDYPNAAALARFIQDKAEGSRRFASVGAVARSEEPIAIVGMSCRLPGEVASPEQLWELVAAGRDGVSGFPANRGWDLERLYDPDPDTPGTSYVREGGFLHDAAGFDAEFFGISPHEALIADPQQRLLLEAAWEALEDAGIDPRLVRGSPTGVFTGVMYHDYGRGSAPPGGHDGPEAVGSVVSGRIAYTLGLEGPAVSIDTACSSSLVAMHLASQALRGGECEIALAGGVAVMSTPSSFIEFSRQRGLAPDGRSKSFAATADGVGWSEGVGLLVLERLSDAQRNGHRVLATMRGSAVNQDGASNGLTAPNGPSQERVIRQALANAGLKASEVDAVEAHGTGTTLGDPIEAQAILATYGQERGEAKPLALGSLKSNIGHAQAAAGVAGVIKTVMAMRHGVLPKSLHIDEPTPEVDWEAAVELLREATPWEEQGRPRRAGVSSFGISGTNAHVILEQGPEPEPQPDPDPETPPLEALPFLLSAKSPEALSAQAGRLAAHLEARPELSELDLSFSLATTRATLEHRAAVVGSGREQLLAGLDALVRGEPHAGLVEGKAVGGKLAFMLSGQGAQRPGMGQSLYTTSPIYTQALDAVCEQLDPLLGLSLKDHLFAKPKSAKAKRLNNTELTQPALFATEVALYRLLESLGLKPDFLIGHSVGEIGAAHLAGVLSLPDAAKLIAARAQLMGALPEGGAMVAIEAAEQELGELPEDVSLAAVNDPTSLVVSGPEQPVLALAQEWKERGRKTNRLSVSHAFHSVLMEPMLEELKELAATLTFNPPRIPVISNLSGEPLTPEQAASPAYWAAQARGAVRFAQGISYLQAQGTTSYLELGPDGVLCAMAQGSLEGEQASLAPLLRKGRPDTESLLGALAQAHCHGVSVDWPQLFAGQAPQRADLPTYAFQRSRYWLEPRQASGDASSIGQGATDHPLLTATTSLAGQEQTLLSGRLSQKTHPWLADHVVHASAILPGTAFVEMALRAGQEAGAPTIEELTLAAPLVLPATAAVQVQVKVNAPDEQGRREIEIHSRPEASSGEEVGEWVANATGLLSAEEPPAPEPLGAWPPDGAEPVAIEAIYEQLGALGIDYGPAFSGLAKAWRQGAELFAEVELPPELSDPERYGLHPALLDAALHVGSLELGEEEELRVPFFWSGVSLHNPGASTLRVRAGAGAERAGIEISDGSGMPALSIGGLQTRAIDAAALRAASSPSDSLFGVEWVGAGAPSSSRREAELFECHPDPELDPAAAAEALCAEVLAALQGAIAADQSLTFLTRNAQALAEGESADPAAAAVWGLVRSAQAEHPGRFALIDSDGEEASTQALPAALAVETEPQLAIRAGALRAPRLRPVAGTGQPTPLDPEATVLITGATGGLGALFARHLVTEHGARRLLLVSRSGPEAEGAAELEAELAALGAEARIAACDVSDREALGELIDSIPAAHPLGAVVHAAGALDDATIEALDPERLGAVFAPKASAAWHLHELTAAHELSHFVLFSSVAGAFGTPGQGNYAAANAFLDGLAAKRQAAGLPAASLAWGAWEQESGMVARLDGADRARLNRSGISALSEEQGLGLFDRCLELDRAQLLPVALDRATLRAAARAGILPPLFSAVIRAPARRDSDGGKALAQRLAGMSEAERGEAILDLVRAEAAAILGHASPASLDPERAFNDLGFDSLGAVELRNRLGGATGLQLPASLIFDYPNAAALARFIQDKAEGSRRFASVGAVARSEEPIAIVGMSCRLPGEVASPEQLWELVAAGRDGVSGFPANRGWDLERLYDPDPDTPGTSYVREGGFLHDAAGFDAEFFGISPHEALIADPQQRLLLEAAWEALEDAGIDPRLVRGSPTGVFTGVMYHDYGRGSAPPGGHDGPEAVGSVVSGRIAYTLGLEGPAVSIDTACSSSLVAMHLASQALRGGECEIALAGGVAVMSTPSSFIEFSRQRGLAPDGRSKSFAATADGVGWSEGVGLLVLERLSDAQRNGHRVLATMRGSAVNQDGASNGLTAPNGPSQERVIRQALANAGLKASEVDAVEAHGTGTTLGDPIEAQAILATYGQERGEAKPLALGSLKSNIGHAQAAAGVAGVIKTVMAMRHGVLPKSLHIDEPTPEVDWEAGAVELLREATPWEEQGRPRRAGVSSFGISGTNAHVILEQGPEPEPQPDPDPETPPLEALPFLLSAKSPEALSAQAGRLAAHLEARPELSELDLSFSLATTRATLEHRAAVVGSGREQLLAGLDALVRGEPHAGLVEGKAVGGKLAFMLSGQGAQRPGMGQSLYTTSPIYTQALDAVCEQLDPLLGLSLKDHLFAKPKSAKAKRLNNTELTQPALFATEVALYRLLESLGLKPDFLIGHSVGEIGAAHLAGVLSLPDAAKLIAARAQLMGALPEGGAMVAIEAAEQELGELPEDVSLAAVNDPTSLVVSGPEQPVLELAQEWKERGRKTNRLSVSHAFHSVLMEPMLEELKELAATLTFNPPRIPVISNLSGEPLTPEQAASPAYWAAQARGAVRFAQGISYLQAQGTTSYLELGPDGVLCAMAQGSLEGEQASLAPLLRKGRPDTESLLGALAQAHCHGVSVDWPQLFAGQAPQRADLPTYAFQRSRYWLEPRQASGDASSIGQGATDHPLLTATTSLAGQEQTLLSGRLSQKTHPWLADHVVHASAILPGTAFVEMALRAGQEAGAPTIEELTLAAPLVLPATAAVQVQVKVNAPDEQGRREIEIHSRPEASSGEEVGEWVANATGLLSAEEPPAPEPLGAWPPDGAEPVAIEAIYEQLGALGIDYGPAFSGLAKAWRQGAELFAEVELPPELSDPERYGLHPALLDAALHVGSLELGEEEELRVPFFWSGVSLHNPGASTLRVRAGAGAERAGIEISDGSGMPALSIGGLQTRAIDAAALRAASSPSDSLFGVEWVGAGAPSSSRREAELFECHPDPELDPAAAAEALCAEVLAALQGAIAADQSLTFLTRNAQALAEGESADPAAAAVWGLVRSAQAEHPGRFALIDSDGEEASTQALPAALAVETEPQLAIRAGALRAPRLRPVAGTGQPTPLDPEATVLITGATGGLGALFARHLVTEHGARRLLLVSRSGPEAEGAAELEAELAALGAEARIAACDVSDREALGELIDSIPAAHPLGAVVHAAGALDDATIEALDPERLGAVFAPKASAAWHLHELTAAHELSHFVLFSSVAGAFGTPGQGNYAAANAFLDGLAAKRQAAGLPAASLAWGAWEQESGMVARLDGADRARLNRSGISALSEEQGLGLFDRCLELDRAQLLPVALDRATLRAAARAGILPPLFSAVIRAPARRDSDGGKALAQRLAGMSEAERGEAILDLVRSHVATVLGHASAEAVDSGASFKDLGFDSLGAVELRNRLGGATGLQLPATMAFDYPTPAAVADFIRTEIGDGGGGQAALDAQIDKLGSMLEALPADQREQADGRLRTLLRQGDRTDAEDAAVDRIRSATAEEILEIVNEEIGVQ